MNDWERDHDLVDQVFFRWQGNAHSPQSQRNGIAPVAHSCDEARAWQLYQELAPLLRVEGGPDRPSLVRTVVSTGEVVLIHRLAGKEPGGRPTTNCHALVGSRKQLSILPSIALVAWKWPATPEIPYAEGGGPRIDPVRHDILRVSWRETSDRMRRLARELTPQLTEVTAAVLRAPGHRLSVKSERLADPGELNMAAPLLWGLHEIFGNRFTSEFNFATFDTTDEHGLGIVFVPEWQASAAGDPLLSRISLEGLPEPGAVPPRDRAEEIARELVRRYESSSGRERSVAELLKKAPWKPAAPVEQQLEDLAALLELRQRAGDQLLPPPTGQPKDERLPPPAEPLFDETFPDGELIDMTPHEPPSVPMAATGHGHVTLAEAGREREFDVEVDTEANIDTLDAAAASVRYGPAQEPDPDPDLTPAPASTSAPAPLLVNSFTMPDRFTVRAFLGEWRRRRRAVRRDWDQSHFGSRQNDLFGLPSTATKEDPAWQKLLGQLRCLPDARLLKMLEDRELHQAARNLLLQALADRTRHRGPREARRLCTRLLQERLYLYPDESRLDRRGDEGKEQRMDESAVHTASWLFAWGVRPYVRDRDQQAGLADLLRTVAVLPTGADRALLLRISVAPYDGTPADFTPRIWQKLLETLVPEARSAADVSRAKDQRARQHRRRRFSSGSPARPSGDQTGAGGRTRWSVESRVFVAGAILFCVLLILLFLAFS
ncbi:hypothetical protein [Streptomyces sp. NPDC020747]|uniref:hypothetical protein n=1 Tax=Streptomyces sp. NPDC020747 TaxID=3365086 RepID=UPI0037A99A22